MLSLISPSRRKKHLVDKPEPIKGFRLEERFERSCGSTCDSLEREWSEEDERSTYVQGLTREYHSSHLAEKEPCSGPCA